MSDVEWVDRARKKMRDGRHEWSNNLARLRQPFVPTDMTDAWLVGLRAAGVDATLAKRRRPGDKWATPLEFVIEFPCPFWHRGEDKTGVGKTGLLVENDAWVEIWDDASCSSCDWLGVTAWLVTCQKCLQGDDSGNHSVGHGVMDLDRMTLSEGEPAELYGDRSPLAFVALEFERRALLAECRWMVKTDGAGAGAWRMDPAQAVAWALASLESHADPVPSAVPSKRAVGSSSKGSKAKESKVLVLSENEPRSEPKPERQTFTDESGRAWLDERGIPFSLGVQALWKAIKEAEADPLNRPPRALIEAMKRVAARAS